MLYVKVKYVVSLWYVISYVISDANELASAITSLYSLLL